MDSSPIFIAGAHKSGTTLLRNLLDGHPDLMVIPFESHYFQLRKTWILNKYRKTLPKKQSVEEILTTFKKQMEFQNTTYNKFADGFVKGKIDVNKFVKIFSKQDKSISEKKRLKLYWQAIRQSLPLPANGERIVEKSVENAETAQYYASIFPNAHFIHILRNPYNNLVSIRNFKIKTEGEYPLIHKIIELLENNFYFLYRNMTTIKNYHVVQYEQLTQNPHDTIKKICRQTGIKHSQSLLTPTVLGKPWEGNSTRNHKSYSIVPNSDKWKKEIKPFEVYYVNRLFNKFMRYFNCKKIPYKGSFYQRHPNEKIKKYTLNRLFRLFID